MKKLTKFLAIFTLILSSCSEPTRLDSDEFTTAEARIKILKKEVRVFSEIQDGEFEFFNVNGFNSQSHGLTVPGSSSLDYKFVVKVDTADISKWTEGMVETDTVPYDDNWTKEIIKGRAGNWNTTCKPTYFVRQGENANIILYKDNGIIFKRVITN